MLVLMLFCGGGGGGGGGGRAGTLEVLSRICCEKMYLSRSTWSDIVSPTS